MDFFPAVSLAEWKNTEKVFNTFTGFKAAHALMIFGTLNYTAIGECIANILYHIREVLCDGQEPSYQYFMHWLAHMIKHPVERLGICTLLKSQEGVGKMSFWDFVGEHLIGMAYYSSMKMSRMFAKFNANTTNKFLVVLEEIKNGEGTKYHKDLKTHITNKKSTVEPKGIDPYDVDNYSNFVILTNEQFPVRLTVNDRQFFCLDVSNKHKNDPPYWDKLLLQFNEENGRLLFQYLQQFDLSTWNCQAIPRPDLEWT